MPVEYQIMIIYAATQKYLLDIPVDRILDYESALFEHVKTKYPEIPDSIREKKVLEEDIEKKLVAAIEEAKESFLK